MGPARLTSYASLLKLLLVCAIVVLCLEGFRTVTGWSPSWHPFADKTVDRTGAAVLKSLTDLSDYHPVSAHYETVVDTEQDTPHLPSWVSGERVIYVGKGDVDAIVDFGELDSSRVQVDEDRRSVSVDLPEPTIGTPVLDLDGSYVAAHDEGLLNRFSGSDLEHQTQLEAIAKMTRAATGDTDLVDRAEDNTTAMLRGLLGSLGYTDIQVTYDD